MTPTTTTEATELKRLWNELREENSNLRIREAAEMLGVSEAELLATDIGSTVTKLDNKCAEILQELHKLKRIMALTRNEAIVHERKGEYKNVEIMTGHGKMGLAVNEDIDVRIFFDKWRHAFAVTGNSPRGATYSFQFFGADGTAIHKVSLTEASDFPAYEKLLEKYRSAEQNSIVDVQPTTQKTAETPDAEIDVEAFRAAWANLQDTHDFFPMLRKFSVAREQALRLADEKMARKVSADSHQFILEEASKRRLPIMIFVGNPGIIQIHTGKVERIAEARGWFNVLDERFNLYIKQDKIASAWIVKKPTADGIVTSLELFNDQNENVALFFGKRKPGIAESEDWRELVRDLSDF